MYQVEEPLCTNTCQSTATMAPIPSPRAREAMSMTSSVPSRLKLGFRLAFVFDFDDNCPDIMQQKEQEQSNMIERSTIGTAKRKLPRARATTACLVLSKSISSILPLFIHLPFLIFSSSHTSKIIFKPTQPSFPFLPASLSFSLLLPTASAYQVTWNNGPEDNYFCGMKWDDPQPCSVRQNCRTGKHEECEGFAEGEKCFAFTDCDSKAGGGHDFVPKIPDVTPTAEPTGSSMPSLAPLPPGPTKIPTEMPIGPPPPLDRSDDPTDYWFCGIGIDDTNQRCETHCPTASECPLGEICYFGTRCDARTHAPTPPPTRRPTDSPTPSPTTSPTLSSAPSWSPTASSEPSVAPTKQGPTKSPTRSPTKRPTWSPLTDVQTEMFCGLSWQDVTSMCRERCPSGEDTECPEGFFCFAYTGCQEEKGYPEDEYQHLNGHGDEESEGSGNLGGKDDETKEEEIEPCVPFQVTITPDNWPQEISWTLTNEAGEVVADDGNEEMVKGEPYVWLKCIPRRECYEFKIMDSGGDGLCCDHGDGNYKVDFNEQLVKVGAAFYNDEIVEVGVCGETTAPTKAETASPTIAPTVKTVKITKAPTAAEELNADDGEENDLASAISPSGKAYRCVSSQLVNSGYALSASMCDKFDGCYNEWIDAGDDWFCDEGSQCVVAPACGANSGGDDTGNEDGDGNNNGENADADANTGDGNHVNEEEHTETARPTPNPTPAVATRPKRTSNPTRTVVSRTKRPTPKPVALPSRPQRPVAVIAPDTTSNPTSAPITAMRTQSPTKTPSAAPTQGVSTMSPTTISPTLGPCEGDPCPTNTQCRSQYGFCGPDELYCNERSIWTGECGAKEPTSSPIVATMPTELIPSVTNSPVQSTTTKAPILPVAEVPSFKKPSGGGKPKPSGGKSPSAALESQIPVPTTVPQSSKPTDPPQSNPPTVLSTWIIFPKPTPSPTPSPTSSPTPAPNTPPPNNENYVVLNSSDVVTIDMITNSPTAGLKSEGALDSKEEEDDSDEDTNCSGDPCPVASHCRSRYGSCGPGFIYCNQYTIWTSSCPAKPTKKPTSKPTKSPSAVVEKTKSPVASPSTEPPKNEPTLPTLPKPTLPHLTEPLPVELPDFASSAHSITADEAEEEHETGDDGADDDDSKKGGNDEEETEAKEGNNIFTSNEYLTEWNSWKKDNSGFTLVWSGAVFCIQVTLLVVLSIMSVLC